MAMSGSIRITGVKQTINTLNKLDKELVRTFKANVDQIAAPVISDTAGAYNQVGVPLSGMARNWTRSTKGGSSRGMFPYVPSRAGAKLKTRYDTRRNSVGVIIIQQMDPAASIFEVAGRANANRLGASLDQEQGRGWAAASAGRTKVMGPAVYRATRKGATQEIQRLVDELGDELTRKLARQD